MKKNTTDHSNHNIALLMTRKAGALPYKRAVVMPEARDPEGRAAYSHLTFRQLDRASDCLAAGLESVGIGRETRTVLMVKPNLAFFVLTFALFKAGAIPTLVDPGMGIKQMVRCLRTTEPEAFIGVSKAHLLRLVYPRHFQSVKTWISVGPRLGLPGLALKTLLNRSWKPYSPALVSKDDPAAILFTTGSTGPAKGVIYTHGIFGAQVRHIASHFQIDADEIDLPTFPLFALFDPALGMTAVIPDMDPTQPAKANPKRIIEAIVNQGVTNMFASPALLNTVGRFGSYHGIRLPSLRRVVSAGAPVSPGTIATFSTMLAGKAQIHTPYGATEAVPVLSIGSREILTKTRKYSERGFGMCVGRPLKGIDVCIIKIMDESIDVWSDALLMKAGEIGEIAVRGDLVTRGYFSNPVADALSKIKANGTVWHRMGDLGWMDKDGRVWFCGRKSHRVIRTRGDMYTIPCEAVFNNHSQVFRSALVGLGNPPDQKPVICIELVCAVARKRRKAIKKELLALAAGNDITRDIDSVLFHKSFPVDIRHNSKIFREKLAVWAGKKLGIKRR